MLSDATDDINIESAAAEFVKNYLGSDDNDATSSGDRLLTALGREFGEQYFKNHKSFMILVKIVFLELYVVYMVLV